MFCIILCISFSSNLFAATHRYFPFRIQISGIDNDTVEKNVHVTLQNLRSTFHVPMTQEERLHFMRKAPALIQTAVEPYGYFQSHIQSRLVHSARRWFAQFNITLGPALPIKSIQVQVNGEGEKDREFQHFLTHLPFQINSPLQTEKYENAKLKLYDIATELGYFQAKMIKSQIRINLKKYTARIIIIFDTGPRFRFGETIFSTSPFRETFLKRFLTYEKGHYFNAKDLEETQQALIASNYFSQVLIKPKPKLAVNGQVPIDIILIARKRKAYTFGLGYGTDTGVRGTIGLALRHIGHDGHRFHTLLRASPNNSSLTAKYIIPGWHPANELFTIGAGVGNMNQSTGWARNAKFSAGYTVFSKHWKNSLSLAYLNERYNIVGFPNTSTQLVYPTFETKYTNTDHVTHPHKGIAVTTVLTGADHNVLSETDFFQGDLHLNTLYTIRKTNTRLLFRSDLGYTDIANIQNLPLSLQLFAGGSRSVRGYGYNSIGPGRNLVVASTEVQQKIIAAIYLCAFVDAGVVGNQTVFHHINAGAGPGIAWVSPVGTIELTVAEAFTQLNSPLSVQFTMGTAI